MAQGRKATGYLPFFASRNEGDRTYGSVYQSRERRKPCPGINRTGPKPLGCEFFL